VFVLARTRNPGLKQDIAAAYGANYVSTQDTSLHDLARQVGKPDLIVEATGSSALAFECMQVLNLNGALVWTSVTGGNRTCEVPADRINLEWVLGNKLLVGTVNGNRHHFEQGLADLALAEVMYPGVTQRILTTPVEGFENHSRIMRLLVDDRSALKVYVNVAEG
jgi:glucose 1-dehydrogenase